MGEKEKIMEENRQMILRSTGSLALSPLLLFFQAWSNGEEGNILEVSAFFPCLGGERVPGRVLGAIGGSICYVRQKSFEGMAVIRERIASLQDPARWPSLTAWLSDPFSFIPLLPSPMAFLEVSLLKLIFLMEFL